jgi:hypothetical protein
MHDLMGEETEGMGIAALAILIMAVVIAGAAWIGLWEAWRYRDVVMNWITR